MLTGRPEEGVAHTVEGLQSAQASGARLAGDLWCLEVLACAWTAQHLRPEQAARLLGAVARVRERVFYPRLQRQAALVEQAAAALQETLGEAAFATAYAAGRGLSWDEAIAEALAEAVPGDATRGSTVS